MIDVLTAINSEAESIGINYSYEENKQSPLKYPYWVGTYTLTDGQNEDGERDLTVILTGFFRGFTSLQIEQEKEKVINHFKNGRICAVNNSVVAVYFSNSLDIPQDIDDLHKSQIYLEIKYWKGK